MSTRERSWPVPVALVALTAIPLTAGALRLIQLAGGPTVIPADHRFARFPPPLAVHIIGATTYTLVGILQFLPRFRRRHLAWHRRAGRVLSVAGLLVAISALWMTLFYEAQPGTGALLYVLRLVFGSAMAACLVLGVTAVRRHDIAAHRAWMIRAYALALAAGTQAFTEGIGGAIFGTGVLAADLAKGAGWVLNLAVAEWVLRRPARHRSALPTGPQQAGALMNTAPTTYAIRVDGHLDDHWSAWLGELDMTRHDDGTTTVTVSVADQAQLHGVLAGLRDIGAVITELRTTGEPPPPLSVDPEGSSDQETDESLPSAHAVTHRRPPVRSKVTAPDQRAPQTDEPPGRGRTPEPVNTLNS